MKMKKILITAVMLYMSTGCVSTLDKIAGVGQVNTEISEFSGEKLVELSQSHNYSSSGGVNTQFGAKWASGNPDAVSLKLIYNSDSSSGDSFTSYEKISVSINGEITDFDAGRTYRNRSDYNEITKVIYTTSTAYVAMPLDYLKSMVNADDCKIRIYSSDGYEDISFNIEKIGSTEYSKLKLKKFIEEVEKNK